jgi:uncharacterized protein (UPF0332 family)
MSQASKHIVWCLNKAKREVDEGRKHRGLVKIEPNQKKASLHIEKAEHNFKAISYFSKGGYSDWSVSAAFYTLYHCFLAILIKQGYESRNQECTLSVIQDLRDQKKIEFDDKFLEALRSHGEVKEKHEHTVIELREDYQYGIKKSIEEKDKITDLKNICTELLDITKEEVYKKE